MGDKDFVRPVLKSLGVNMKFWKVAQRPGQPFAFGVCKHHPVFCLPGNPVSTLTTFETFVRPALLKMSGRKEYRRPRVTAKMQETVRGKPGFRYFLRVRLTEKNHKHYARLTGPQGPGILKSMVRADGLLVVPENIGVIRKGESWPVILLGS
jgi:molybdopterin molybdotransferase